MLSSKTILVVDDEPALCELLVDTFTMEGVGHILTASSGNAALELIKKTPIDVLISDIRMPDGDGIELLDGILTNNYAISTIIMISGFSLLTQEEAFHKGACALLMKPCDIDVLIQTIEHHVLMPQARWVDNTASYFPSRETKLSLDATSKKALQGGVKLGKGGLFVPMEREFPSNNAIIRLFLTHSLPNFPQMEMVGQCRWVRATGKNGLPSGIGIEFLKMSAESLKSLTHLWELHPTKSFIPMG